VSVCVHTCGVVQQLKTDGALDQLGDIDAGLLLDEDELSCSP
jgi:hypothetical protein